MSVFEELPSIFFAEMKAERRSEFAFLTDSSDVTVGIMSRPLRLLIRSSLMILHWVVSNNVLACSNTVSKNISFIVFATSIMNFSIREINDNLEAMAKQLYDYWLVQFDFPNEEGKPYKSSGGVMVWNEKLKREIPEEWNVANIFDELSVQYGFPFSTELFTEEPTNIPIVRIRDILENSVSAYSEEEVDEKYKLQKQDLVIGMDGNFHMNYWNDNVSYLNQRSVRLRTKSKSTVSIMQAKYDIAPYIKAKELRSKGSTVGHLSDKDLKELFVLVSPNADFRNKFDSILAEIIKNRCEMIELTKQRDELLPLLMNGQATVNSD